MELTGGAVGSKFERKAMQLFDQVFVVEWFCWCDRHTLFAICLCARAPGDWNGGVIDIPYL